jgi:hypothetical protein
MAYACGVDDPLCGLGRLLVATGWVGAATLKLGKFQLNAQVPGYALTGLMGGCAARPCCELEPRHSCVARPAGLCIAGVPDL